MRVYRVVPDGPDTLVGSRRSDRFGLALVRLRNPDLATIPGRYYAVVDKSRGKFRGQRFKCGGDRSPTVTVNEPSSGGSPGALPTRRRSGRTPVPGGPDDDGADP